MYGGSAPDESTPSRRARPAGVLVAEVCSPVQWSPMTTLVLIWCIFLVVAAVTIKAWWGDGRTDLRRCPRCWYDMSATETKLCPECGHTAKGESDLHRRRSSRRVCRAGVVILCVLALAGVLVAMPGPWTNKVPRPLMRLLLSVAASPPAPPTARPGSGLPVPVAALKASKSAWDRLVWQHQVSIAFRAWADGVQATQGPITDAELARLVPLAEEAHALFAETGGLLSIEAWGHEGEIERMVARRTAAAGNADRLLRAEWTLAELQYIGSGYSWRPDFARVPDAIIQQALAHTDARVRLFGLDRFGRRVHQVVMEPASPMPIGREKVETMATGDADPAVRKRAADLVAYMSGFLPKK